MRTRQRLAVILQLVVPAASRGSSRENSLNGASQWGLPVGTYCSSFGTKYDFSCNAAGLLFLSSNTAQVHSADVFPHFTALAMAPF